MVTLSVLLFLCSSQGDFASFKVLAECVVELCVVLILVYCSLYVQ